MCNDVTNAKLSNYNQENITLLMRGTRTKKAFWRRSRDVTTTRKSFGLLDSQEMQTKFSTRCTPPYGVQLNVPLVGASMALHNFIRRNSSDDEVFNRVAIVENFTFNDIPNVGGVSDDNDGEAEGNDDIHMNEVRKSIRNELV
ncbi:hypothetical protein ACSBR2_040543 [Camellia fascicularis]